MSSPSIQQLVDAVKKTSLSNRRWIPLTGKGSLYIRPLLIAHWKWSRAAPFFEDTFLVYASPVGNYFKEGTSPLKLYVEDEFHRATRGGAGGVKNITNYAPTDITRKLEKSSLENNEPDGNYGFLSRSEIPHGEHPLSLGKSSVWNKFFQDTRIMEQIDRDVMRTHPDMPFFSGYSIAKSNQDALRNILIVFAQLNPGIRYVQGMNEILAPLYYVFTNDPDEENTDNILSTPATNGTILDGVTRKSIMDIASDLGKTWDKVLVSLCFFCLVLFLFCLFSSWMIFSLRELQLATNNFNYDDNLGEGGFDGVYLGPLIYEVILPSISNPLIFSMHVNVFGVPFDILYYRVTRYSFQFWTRF